MLTARNIVTCRRPSSCRATATGQAFAPRQSVARMPRNPRRLKDIPNAATV